MSDLGAAQDRITAAKKSLDAMMAARVKTQSIEESAKKAVAAAQSKVDTDPISASHGQT